MHLMLVGATSSIAEHCARLWLRQGISHVTLIGRAGSNLQAIAADFRARCPTADVEEVEVEFTSPQQIQQAVSTAAQNSPIDIALVAHGNLPDQSRYQNAPDLIAESLWTNGVSAVLFTEVLACAMAGRKGQLGVISSVAGDRGRKSNYIYGSAKSMVSTYVEGLQHRLAQDSLRISLIKPGPVRTPMTDNMDPQPKGLAEVEVVAKEIVENMAKGRRIIYTPAKWRLIMLVIRHLPFVIFSKLNI